MMIIVKHHDVNQVSFRRHVAFEHLEPLLHDDAPKAKMSLRASALGAEASAGCHGHAQTGLVFNEPICVSNPVKS
jgi:hypothetical protein